MLENVQIQMKQYKFITTKLIIACNFISGTRVNNINIHENMRLFK